MSRVSLRYTQGADAALDRPAHVRAASGLARTRAGLALVQDDANFIAIVSDDGALVRAMPLPAGEGGMRQFDDTRGNKAHKLDLEACVVVEDEGDELLLAFGSGSTSRREWVVLMQGLDSESPDVSAVYAPLLYEALRREHAFAGSELNIEGAVYLGARLRLFGRGNGAIRGGVRPVNASCDLDWTKLRAHLRDPWHNAPPGPSAIVRYELGALDGVPLSFTDAAVWGAGGDAVLYSAAAEDSPDAVRDGRVAGSAIGIIGVAGETRWAPLVQESGEIFPGKVEGLAPVPQSRNHLHVVADADNPSEASVLFTVELRGVW
ncbi:MAG: hypothetical protein WD825_13450 [Gemmatimonadaceae bacterium]